VVWGHFAIKRKTHCERKGSRDSNQIGIDICVRNKTMKPESWLLRLGVHDMEL
jgi:hypothetical protein